jgi:hypothetical protein
VAFFTTSASSSVRRSEWVSSALLIARGFGTAGVIGADWRPFGSGWLRLAAGQPEWLQVTAHGLGVAFEPEGAQSGSDGLGVGHALVPALVDQVDEGVKPGGRWYH